MTLTNFPENASPNRCPLILPIRRDTFLPPAMKASARNLDFTKNAAICFVCFRCAAAVKCHAFGVFSKIRLRIRDFSSCTKGYVRRNRFRRRR